MLLVILRRRNCWNVLQKKLQKTNQKEFRAVKVMKRKGDKLYFKWKSYDNSFNSWIDKKDIVYVSEYFPTPKPFGGNVKVELDLSNYATKADLKNANTWKFASKKV